MPADVLTTHRAHFCTLLCLCGHQHTCPRSPGALVLPRARVQAQVPVDPQRLEELQRREREVAEHRAALLRAKQAQQGSRQRRQEQMAEGLRVCAPADPSRLLQPTKAHQLRCVAESGAGSRPAEPVRVADVFVPQLIVPSWRGNA